MTSLILNPQLYPAGSLSGFPSQFLLSKEGFLLLAGQLGRASLWLHSVLVWQVLPNTDHLATLNRYHWNEIIESSVVSIAVSSIGGNCYWSGAPFPCVPSKFLQVATIRSLYQMNRFHAPVQTNSARFHENARKGLQVTAESKQRRLNDSRSGIRGIF